MQLTTHLAIDVGDRDVPPFQFTGDVPRVGEFLIFAYEDCRVHGRVTAVEWGFVAKDPVARASVFYEQVGEAPRGN